jgi:hypothetical protein
LGNVRFSKVLMNAALQHFTWQDFKTLLMRLMSQTVDNGSMLFAFLPDFYRREAFEDVLKRSARLRLRRLLHRDLIGVCWKRGEVAAICNTLGLIVEFLDVAPALDGARYRVDIRIRSQ